MRIISSYRLCCAIASLTMIVTSGCLDGAETQDDAWSLEGDVECTGTMDIETVEQSDSDQEIVCGEPGQVITSIRAAAKLRPCDVYRGSFRFSDTEYSDFRRLPKIRVVKGRVVVEAAGKLQSFKGFERLERVGALVLKGSLGIDDDFSGLSNLRRVDEGLTVYYSYIDDFGGLNKLQSSGSLTVVGCPELSSMKGLSSFQRIRGDFWIESSNKLTKRQIRTFIDGIQVDGEVRID